MIGKTLAGRYQVMERIRGGEYLSTYLAVDVACGLEVEVDILAAPEEQLPVSPARLGELLDAAILVNGTHVSCLRDWGEEAEEDFVYMVREKSCGASLAEVLSCTGELPRQQVVEITAAAVEVLTQAYGKGLFYLGLNPGQVTLDTRGGLKFARVGFGWVIEEIEPETAARVSPYRAPETDGGKEGSRTSDVYSLAVMVREMLPEAEVGGRLASLLDMAVDPLPKHRPSSPRLLLEELREAGVDDGGTQSREEKSPGAPTGKAGGLSFLQDGPFPSPVITAGRHRRRTLRNLLLVVAGGAAIWLAFAAVAGLLGSKPSREAQAPAPVEEKIALPDLQGFTAHEAEEILAELGLECTSREAPSRLWSAGRVAAQEPAEGSTLRPGDIVCLIVSTGRSGEPLPGAEDIRETGGSDPSPSPPQSTGALPQPAPLRSSPASQPALNLPPRAVPSISRSSGVAPLYVSMDGSASFDPDGDIVRYVWHCGDGTVIEGARAQHVYDPAVIPARFRVVLEVYDGGGLHDSSALTLEVY